MTNTQSLPENAPIEEEIELQSYAIDNLKISVQQIEEKQNISDLIVQNNSLTIVNLQNRIEILENNLAVALQMINQLTQKNANENQ